MLEAIRQINGCDEDVAESGPRDKRTDAKTAATQENNKEKNILGDILGTRRRTVI